MNGFLMAATLALLVTSVAGCIGNDASDDNAATNPNQMELPIDKLLGTGDEHSHEDVDMHLGSFNLRLAAWAPLVPENEIMSTGFTDPWFVGDRAYIATQGTNAGFLVADVSNPYDPQYIGQYKTGDNLVWDVKVTEDNQFAFLGAQLPAWALQQRPPEDQGDVLAMGIHAVDVSGDRPELAGFYQLPPLGGHNVFTYTLDGAYLVFATSAYDVQVLRWVPSPTGMGSFVHLSNLEATIDPRDHQSDPLGILVHDLYVEKHPVTGQTLAYVAWWDQGLRIFDISIPAAPIEIGVWKDFDPADEGNLHYVQPHRTGLIGDRHITVTGPEFTSDDSDGYLNVLDTTDPTNPTKVAHWNLPGDNFQNETGRFSAHNFDVADGLVALGAYHSGLWVIRIADTGTDTLLDEPKTVGYTLPMTDDPDKLTDDGIFGPRAPNLWGARMHKGLIWGAETSTGLHSYRLDESMGWDPMVDATGDRYVPLVDF